jgi:predicted MPP superfamily phosphohydrolase
MPISRRGFLKVGGITIASLLTIAGGLSLMDESHDPVVERISIPIKGLHPALEGFTIVQLSDIHLLPYTQRSLVRKAVEMVNQLQADLVVMTGDFVYRVKRAAQELAPILAELKARYGVYSVMGNHDYWLDYDAFMAAFTENNLILLINQGVSITVGEGVLYLAGMDDVWSGQPDLDLTLEDAPDGAPVVLLVHEPDTADQISRDPRVSLQLSGHTHGGQVIVPGKPPFFHPYLGEKYWSGLYRINNMWLYTNRGLGNTSVPLRINCPPELSQLVLIPG